MADKCSYRGCPNASVEGRMYCSDHTNDDGVSGVASIRTDKVKEERERADLDPKSDKDTRFLD
jgi:hypothetical protein